MQGALAVVGVLFIVAVVAAGWAFSSSRTATMNAARADRQRDAAHRTLSRFHADLSRQQTDAGFPVVGVLLALEALPRSMTNRDRPYVPEAEVALDTGLRQMRQLRAFHGHTGPVLSTVFDEQGRHLVTGSADKTARVWEVEDREGVGDSVRAHGSSR